MRQAKQTVADEVRKEYTQKISAIKKESDENQTWLVKHYMDIIVDLELAEKKRKATRKSTDAEHESEMEALKNKVADLEYELRSAKGKRYNHDSSLEYASREAEDALVRAQVANHRAEVAEWELGNVKFELCNVTSELEVTKRKLEDANRKARARGYHP